MTGNAGVAKASEAKPPSGLSLIESFFFNGGVAPATELLERMLGSRLEPYSLVETGSPCHGLQIRPDDQISYLSFSPPANWNAAYSIQRITLGPAEKKHFVSHSGEELFIPLAEHVFYHFFFSPGRRAPHRSIVKFAGRDVSAVRINPQIPHHAWGAAASSEGWLVLRHATDSPTALVMDDSQPRLSLALKASRPDHKIAQEASVLKPLYQRLTSQELERPGTYAMIAWGLAEAIRNARQKSSLTVSQLAKAIGIDASSLSRLEDAKANVSIEMLGKVSRALRIGLSERIASGTWTHDVSPFLEGPTNGPRPLLPVSSSAHTLHPYAVRLQAGSELSVFTGCTTDPLQMSSWILLTGSGLVEMPAFSAGRLRPRSLLLDAGSVLHFREHGTIRIKALQDLAFAQIVCSQECRCAPRSSGGR